MSAPATRSAVRVALDLAAVALLIGGVLLVRNLTQTKHYDMPADSRLRVVVEPAQNRSEPSQALAAVARAHLAFCDVEVAGAIEGEPEVVEADDRLVLAVVLAPALDATDLKQFKGCVEDWQVDHHLIRVRSMEEYRVR